MTKLILQEICYIDKDIIKINQGIFKSQILVLNRYEINPCYKCWWKFQMAPQ